MSVLDGLIACSGTWTGTNQLRDPSMDVTDDSDATAELTAILGGTFVRLDYTWSYQGETQQGSLLIGADPHAATVTAHWVDTWHMGRIVMACQGNSEADGSISVLGAYSAPPGPDWGWRIGLQPSGGETLRLVMYNITPGGHEGLAVETNFTRTSENSDG